MTQRPIVAGLLALLTIGVAATGGASRAQAPAPADVVLVNGAIITVDPRDTNGRAVFRGPAFQGAVRGR